MELAYPMKSVSEALNLRNTILQNYENALSESDKEKRKQLMSVVVVGGGTSQWQCFGTYKVSVLTRFRYLQGSPTYQVSVLTRFRYLQAQVSVPTSLVATFR